MKILFLKKRVIIRFAVIVAILSVLGINVYQTLSSNDFVETAAPIYQGNTDEKAVALTFNVDWGENYIPDMLQILEKNNVKATFFITGRWAANNPELTKRIAEKGHELGNHGYSHASPNNLSRAGNRKEIEKTLQILKDITGMETNLFAPPYGEANKHVLLAAQDLNHRTILWSVDTIDWREDTTSEEIIQKIKTKAHNGAIILMHPTPQTVSALPEIISFFKENNYKLGKVSEII